MTRAIQCMRHLPSGVWGGWMYATLIYEREWEKRDVEWKMAGRFRVLHWKFNMNVLAGSSL